MPHRADRPARDPLKEIEKRTARKDPRFARGLADGHPLGPREYRRAGLWVAVAAATALVVIGLVLPNAVCFAGGLILAGLTAALRGRRAPPRLHRRPRRPPDKYERR